MLGDELGPYPQGARPGDSLDMKHARIVTNKIIIIVLSFRHLHGHIEPLLDDGRGVPEGQFSSLCTEVGLPSDGSIPGPGSAWLSEAGLDKIKTFRDRSLNLSKLSVKVRKLRQQNL